MKELLNKLIEKGWKPRGKYEMEYQYMLWWKERWFYDLYFIRWHYLVRVPIKHSLRELVSKLSWLWQFVCENVMVDWHKYDSKTYEVRIENRIKRREIWPEGDVHTNEIWRPRHSAEYRLIESALCDEDKLEDFILDNVKIWES